MLTSVTATRARLEPAPATLYRYVWRVSGHRQVWLVLLACVVFPLTMVPLELQRRIVNHAIAREELRLLWILCGLYVAVVIVQGGLKYVMNVYREMVAERAIRRMRRHLYHAIRDDGGAADPGRPADPAPGSKVSMAVAEVESLGAFVGESISVPLVQTGALLSVLGYMLVVEPRIAAASLALYSPQLFLIPRIQAAINRRVQRRIVLVRELGQHIVEATDGPQTAGGPDARYEANIGEIYRQRIRVAYLSYLVTLINNLLDHSGTISVLLIGGWLAVHGRTDIGTIVAFISGFEKISDPRRELIAFYRRWSDAHVKYRLVRESLGVPTAAPRDPLDARTPVRQDVRDDEGREIRS
jgi:ABC-type multidrug transport system fused ATPase/permease subunit